MKIIKVNGGLGNQMFQFSFFLYLKQKNLKVKLDIKEYNKENAHRGFELNEVFNILKEEDTASVFESNFCEDLQPFFKIRKSFGKILFNNPNHFLKNTHWVEPKYSHFYKEIHKTEHNYLEGYWQNENYLIPNQKLVNDSFQWIIIDPQNKIIADKMALENSVSIHIRRLDTPSNFKQLLYTLRLRLFWRVASKKYYIKALKYISNKIENPQFYVFSDDIAWVKKNLPLSSNFTLIDWNDLKKSNQDMFLMTQCKHNIISMSSFSWWGAWLNNNPDKIIICPKKWVLRFSSKDEIIPKSWSRI